MSVVKDTSVPIIGFTISCTTATSTIEFSRKHAFKFPLNMRTAYGIFTNGTEPFISETVLKTGKRSYENNAKQFIYCLGTIAAKQ